MCFFKSALVKTTKHVTLAQGKTVNTLQTATSYFDREWNAFAQQKERWFNSMDSLTDC
jgi:hypothetical protein